MGIHYPLTAVTGDLVQEEMTHRCVTASCNCMDTETAKLGSAGSSFHYFFKFEYGRRQISRYGQTLPGDEPLQLERIRYVPFLELYCRTKFS
jgi:hypothetical protein